MARGLYLNDHECSQKNFQAWEIMSKKMRGHARPIGPLLPKLR